MCNVAISERSQDMYAVLPDIVPAYPLHSLVYWFINVDHVFSFGETSALAKWLFEFTASWSQGSFHQKSRYSSAAATATTTTATTTTTTTTDWQTMANLDYWPDL
jgi:hypothetical protein